MTSREIRQRFLDFFKQREHVILPSASLVTSDEKGVTNATLFNMAGVQPLIPALLNGHHPQGSRLASAQKCVRTVDIEEAGDNTHATFFEMLGNWSIGDYFKEDAIKWSFEFLTSKDHGLGLDPTRLYVTVFEGDENAPRDTEAYEIWKRYMPENRIYFMGAKSNWWSAGDNGPCGPDTEMFYDVTGTLGDLTKEEYMQADDEQKVIEIWNDVFMEYEKKDGVVVGKLPKQNVDTGAGLERLTAIIQEKESIFDTDLFAGLVEILLPHTQSYQHACIVADHIKASIFILGDGVVPSNTDRGYILRRLLRRAIFKTTERSLAPETIRQLVEKVASMYADVYPNITEDIEVIIAEIERENDSFIKTIQSGTREFEKIATGDISAHDAFTLFSTYGFPLELTQELAQEKGLSVDVAGFETEFKQHQERSRTAAEGKFKGGLASHGEMETKYHTATHLLHAALREVLGDHVFQKGSNITADRLRFDFSHPEKMTDEEKQKVEDLVNEKIKANFAVTQNDMSFNEAKELGAMGLFEDKYGDVVSVYTIGNDTETFSRELCGGPHVSNTGDLGHFKIKKEEASSAGIRRIKAILE